MASIINDKEELYILGKPVTTNFGTMRPIKVDEYDEFLKYYPLLINNEKKMKHILFDLMLKKTDNKEVLKDYRDRLKDNDYVTMIHENTQGLMDDYKEMFNYLLIDFDDADIFKIMKDDETWRENRHKLLLFNGIVAEDASSNKEIEYFNTLKKEMNKAKGNAVNFESVYTSIIAFTGMKQDDVSELTLYAFYSIFHRINKFKNYDTSIQFKTVDYKDKVDIEQWYKPKEYHDNKNTISKEELISMKEEIK